MKRIVRGLVGFGLVGAGVGFLGGALWGVISALARSGIYWDPAYLRFVLRLAAGNALGFMKIGGFTAVGFGLFLAVLPSRRSLDDLSLLRMALLGAFVGASFPPVYVISRMGLSAYLQAPATFLPAMAGLGCLGGALTSSLVLVAKRAARAELPPVAEDSE